MPGLGPPSSGGALGDTLGPTQSMEAEPGSAGPGCWNGMIQRVFHRELRAVPQAGEPAEKGMVSKSGAARLI